MCLWFACFGLHKDDDITYTAPTRSLALPPPATKPQLHDRPMPAAQRNGGYYNNGHAHYANGGHHQTVSRQQPAWNGSVAGEAGHGHGTQAQQQQQQNYYNYHERQPVHREAAMDHRYSTATATAVHERY
ncbi:unnamed protein product [Urochloa decumbens]|uniref:Uncharacterized protein n=1 Tax=Urochloa decumbens TaxID=240449 RepID=A0ABC9AIC4_9POAL